MRGMFLYERRRRDESSILVHLSEIRVGDRRTGMINFVTGKFRCNDFNRRFHKDNGLRSGGDGRVGGS